MRAFALTEDQKLTQKIEEGDKFKSIHTKNMLNLKSGDFSTFVISRRSIIIRKHI